MLNRFHRFAARVCRFVTSGVIKVLAPHRRTCQPAAKSFPSNAEAAQNASGKRGYGYTPLLSEHLAVKLDALDLMQRLGREIALATMRTTDDRHVFDHEQACSLAVTARDPADLCTALATHIANHKLTLFVEHRNERQFVGRPKLDDHCHVVTADSSPSSSVFEPQVHIQVHSFDSLRLGVLHGEDLKLLADLRFQILQSRPLR